MIPHKELDRRIKKLQAAMQKNDLAGALLVQRADLFYFSGTGQNAHLFVPAEGEAVLIVKKSILRAEQESTLPQIIPFKGWGELAALIARAVPKGSKIGLENDVLPANLYFRYQKLLDGFQTADLSGIIRSIRAVKSSYELEIMSKAAAISEAVFNHVREILREGLREVELAGQLELKARILGHQGAVRMRGFNQELYFGHIMAGESASAVSFFDGPTGGNGLNPSYPQGAGMMKVNNNEPVLVDFVSVYEGYMVDQTRIFCLGKPPLKLLEAYNSAVEIKNTLAKEGKPGVLGSDLFMQAEKQAAKAGLANHFMGYTEKVSFVGHGVGIELDELPVIAKGLDLPLEEGMVFALEPKFIFPGEGAVGIEDTFVVRRSGLQQITRFSDELQII
jgi:Xaa-Pro dipeptidase